MRQRAIIGKNPARENVPAQKTVVQDVRKYAAGNLYDLDCPEAALRELQRRYIDVSLYDSTNPADVCLVDFTKGPSLMSRLKKNSPDA